jgi:hypothetical protein
MPTRLDTPFASLLLLIDPLSRTRRAALKINLIWMAGAARKYDHQVIIGAHSIIYSRDAEATREFVRDKLGMSKYVDAGGGWLIFALPPAELAVHPDDTGGRLELYLMCDDITRTVDELKAKGVEFTSPVSDQRWGLLTSFKIPGGGELGLYEPRHPIAIDLKS